MIHERRPEAAIAVGPLLRLDGISRSFGQTKAVDGVSLEIAQGEFVTLLGDSGCGKTTLLRIVAGYVAPERGRVLLVDRDITALAPARRRMGFVFQSYALFPHLDVGANIAFALRLAGEPMSLRRSRTAELAEMLEIAHLLDRFPHELSGGQQQRVAMARALASSPQLLLLDEPMSALDARIRTRLRDELKALITRIGLTALYVTHDQEEALAMSDRICVMHSGRLEQVGTPAEIYHRPATRFVAEFVGLSNIIDGIADAGGFDAGGEIWPLPSNEARLGAATLVYRPEAIDLSAFRGGGDPRLVGRIERIALLGALQRLWVRTRAGRLVLVERPSVEVEWRAGMAVSLAPDPERGRLLAVAA
ncbi:ABC transporter ATP-binding protein [Paracoccus suum]|uniref:ABC transporter ATP-binding protein n=1 Tax=Paracoccus suum TaxID=2259340 RepID=A0A344PJ98_9RHOB|nr:ABC transporter ATP-binding protein [Paracoccus suum]AXC49453.1 ABC transporter ATP-binding protein [Paracoccus suum]